MQLWTPNQTLKNGRFIVQKVLGGGGFGVTYSILEPKTNKLFAIKTLNPINQSQSDFADKQEQFVNEALRLRGCQHPHIVKVYEVIQEAGLWGMVMEYIQGDDLGIYVDKHGQLSEEEALRYINQVGEALEYVHQQGFLHRDVKPNNIILRDGKQAAQKEAVLIDFGLAREFTIGQTLSMTNSKTQGYAPIEQYERQGRFTAATDVYALAATLYSLLTTEVPFPANFRKQGIPLPPPKQFNSGISDRVNDAIIKGMALEQQDRPQTVQEWLKLVIPSGNPRIPLQKFQFEYAKINDNLKITRYPAEAEFFTEDLGGGVKLEMVYIPGGTFIMGSPENEAERLDRESPQHQVTIQPFFMGKYPITQKQWAEVAGFPQVKIHLDPYPDSFKGGINLPIESINWDEAIEFCARLSQHCQKQKRNYRLPSEAEWEYACRAGTTTPFHFGETITTDLANYNGDYTYGNAPKGEYRGKTTEVGQFPANAFGLYDMHGNVWEWCEDDWHESYNSAPSDGQAWLIGNDNHFKKSLRGGSFLGDAPGNCRCAFRYGDERDFRYLNIGFRVVCVCLRAS
jgi:formylglycine-generating enzyme required for sulfatase activity